jgi:DHA1 family multidrug resistance protein-like MFS transporter
MLTDLAFLRSATACAAIHFSQPMFENMGVGKGNSILGGICVACFFCFAGLWYFGPKLRAKSKFAEGC